MTMVSGHDGPAAEGGVATASEVKPPQRRGQLAGPTRAGLQITGDQDDEGVAVTRSRRRRDATRGGRR